MDDAAILEAGLLDKMLHHAVVAVGIDTQSGVTGKGESHCGGKHALRLSATGYYYELLVKG